MQLKSRCEVNSEPNLCKSYDEAIEKLAKKTCKYMFADGITASYAVHGRFCGKILYTGKPSFLSRQGFILPRNSQYTSVLSRDTLKLAEMDKLATIEQFYDSRGACSSPTESTITMGRLKLFFISAYIACFIIFIEMILDPQEPSRAQSTSITTTDIEAQLDGAGGKSEEEGYGDTISNDHYQEGLHKISDTNGTDSIVSSMESNRNYAEPP